LIIPDLKREKRGTFLLFFFFFIKISEKMRLFAGTVLAKSLSAAV